MTVCKTCKHANYCEIVAGGYSSQVKSCKDYRKGEMTNEEWFCSLPTEEKARFLDKICYSAWGDINSRFRDMADYTDWVEWLKQPHTPKE